MECPACGAGLGGQANFCPDCGHRLRGGAGGEDPDADATAVVEAPEGGWPAAGQVDQAGGRDEDDWSAGAGGELAGGEGGPETAVGPGGLIECPRCGAPNSAGRVACGRCSADLATGEVTGQARSPTPPVPRAPPEGPAEPAARSGGPGPLVAGIVAVGVVAGAVLGLMVSLELGPFAAEEPTSGPTFDPGVYPGDPEPLEVSGVTASSTLSPLGGDRFDTGLLLDGDLSTAWNNDGGEEPDGVGASLTLRLAEPAWVTALVVANGDQADDRTFLSNARARRVRIAFAGGEVVHVHLLDRQGRQRIDLPEPALTRAILVEVVEVYPGDTQDDLGISEVEVLGHTAVATHRQELGQLAPPAPGRSPAR